MDGAGLIEAVEILESNDKIACVQSLWKPLKRFNNALSMAQEQFHHLHIEREQVFKSRYDLWPIFNGAGAVWKRNVIERECGGWMTRCVCEDTDISGYLNMRGYKIHVLPTWHTGIDLVYSWKEYGKQQRRWIQGNGQQVQLHIRDSKGWGFKKLYWISWNLGFFIAPTKYVIPFVMGYKYFHGGCNAIEYLCVLPHLLVFIASGLTWDNKFWLRGWLTYPLHYLFEMGALHWQIVGWWEGFLNYRKIFEFIVTKKEVKR
ncbi:membrane hypothetical protein [Azospirillaceae bacterium]